MSAIHDIGSLCRSCYGRVEDQEKGKLIENNVRNLTTALQRIKSLPTTDSAVTAQIDNIKKYLLSGAALHRREHAACSASNFFVKPILDKASPELIEALKKDQESHPSSYVRQLCETYALRRIITHMAKIHACGGSSKLMSKEQREAFVALHVFHNRTSEAANTLDEIEKKGLIKDKSQKEELLAQIEKACSEVAKILKDGIIAVPATSSSSTPEGAVPASSSSSTPEGAVPATSSSSTPEASSSKPEEGTTSWFSWWSSSKPAGAPEKEAAAPASSSSSTSEASSSKPEEATTSWLSWWSSSKPAEVVQTEASASSSSSESKEPVADDQSAVTEGPSEASPMPSTPVTAILSGVESKDVIPVDEALLDSLKAAEKKPQEAAAPAPASSSWWPFSS